MLWTMGGCIYSVQMTPQISLFLSRKEIEISIPSELHSLSEREANAYPRISPPVARVGKEDSFS